MTRRRFAACEPIAAGSSSCRPTAFVRRYAVIRRCAVMMVLCIGIAGAGLAAPPGKSEPAASTRAAAPLAQPLPPPPLPVRKPAPKPPTTVEGKFHAGVDELLAPLRHLKLTKSNAAALDKAIKAIKHSDLQRAQALQARLGNPTARKLIAWSRLRAGFGTPEQYAAFLSQNPDWPDRKTLIRRAEEQVFMTGGSASRIKQHFKTLPPQTGAGYAALASAYLAEGDMATARKYAGRAWRELSLATTLESGFFERFGSLLDGADHRWRIDRLLLRNSRWPSTRRQRAAKVRRLIPLQPTPAEQQKTRARLAVYLHSKKAAKLMAALPKGSEPDWGLEYQRAQLLLRQKKYPAAWRLLLSAPDDAAKLVNPDAWWLLRRRALYAALERGKIKIAYRLAANPGPISVNPRKDAAFMAGWIALRKLNDASRAARHFKLMRRAADGPLSASKADLWLARALTQLHHSVAARAALRDGAPFIHTFHGQLCRQTLDPHASSIELPPPALPTKAQAARFMQMNAVQAIVIARKAGLPRSITRAFFQHLRYHFKRQPDMLMLAHLAQSNIGLDTIDKRGGDIQMSVRIGKTGIAQKQNLYYYSYPIHGLPRYNPLRKPPERALLLGLARQESEFNGKIRSGAGARGLLQVMPITARHICSAYRIKCSISRLMTDETYNTMIASAYIADRMDEFGGSYVLTLTGYNAGPGRTRQWIRRFGDPRDKSVNTLDWIEQIPFAETRKYVMKVLSNVQVYRARLGMVKTALQIRADLARARTGTGGATAQRE